MNPQTRNDLLVVASVSAASVATRWALRQGWRKTRRSNPPRNPREAGWPAALAWAAGAGLTAAVARVATRRVIDARNQRRRRLSRWFS